MAREYWRWIDGQYTNDSTNIKISGGLTHGYGIFETIYYKDGHIHHLIKHIERLQIAANFYNLCFSSSVPEIASIIVSLIKKNTLTEAKIKLVIVATSNNYSESSIASQFIITTEAYTRVNNTVSLITASAQEFGCPLQRHKSISYASYILAKKHAHNQGFHDTLMSSQDGSFIECSTSNIFFARDGKWFAPNLSTYGLKGIQREIVLNAMQKLEIAISTKDITDLNYDFCIITNSLIGIRIVEKIDTNSFNTQDQQYLDQIEKIDKLLLSENNSSH